MLKQSRKHTYINFELSTRLSLLELQSVTIRYEKTRGTDKPGAIPNWPPIASP